MRSHALATPESEYFGAPVAWTLSRARRWHRAIAQLKSGPGVVSPGYFIESESRWLTLISQTVDKSKFT